MLPTQLVFFFILFLVFLLVCFIVLYFILFHRKLSPQTASSSSNNTPIKPEKLVEIPLQDPIEPGPKPMKSDFAESEGALQLLVLLENSFNKDGVKANISKVIEFFALSRNELSNDYGASEMEELLDKILKLPYDQLLNELTSSKNNYLGFLEQEHQTFIGKFDHKFFLHYFFYSDIFDPKKEFESMSECELKVLESILINSRKFRERIEYTGKSVFVIESYDRWNDLRILINNRPSQRNLLLQLCFVSFDGLNDRMFQHVFCEFLNRPRASPWITNNRLVMTHYYVDQIVSLIIEHQLVSRESISKLNECSSIQSDIDYSKCLLAAEVCNLIPIHFLKTVIVSKFPLWPNSLRYHELRFLVPKLFEKINLLPESSNKSLPCEHYEINDYMDIFRHFQVKHFSLGLLDLLKNFICKYNHTSPDFTLNCEFYKCNWEKGFSPESEFVYPLGEIDKLFGLYSSRIPEIVQITDIYTSSESPTFNQTQIDLIKAIVDSAKDTLLLLAYEVNSGDPWFQSKSAFPLFALLADITRFNHIKNKYESDRGGSDLLFSQLKVSNSYSQLMEYLSFISNKEKYSSYLKLLNDAHLSIMSRS